MYVTFDCNPVIEIGDDDPVSVYPPGVDVTVNDVAALRELGVNDTSARPLLYGLPDPTSVAVPIIGASGAKKSFASWLILPACFDILFPFVFLNYADRSPKTNHPPEIFIAVATEYVVLNLSPGVPTTPFVEANDAPVPEDW